MTPRPKRSKKSARIFFERGMARAAALKSTDEDLKQLRETLEEQRRSLGDAERFIAADMRFHTQIAAISGNPIYTAVSEAMLGWLKTYHGEMLIWTGKARQSPFVIPAMLFSAVLTVVITAALVRCSRTA